MIKHQVFILIIRILASSFGMWLCITLFGTVSSPTDFAFFIAAGMIFSLVNIIIKPLLKIMALPLAILTMGISTIIINIAMLWLTLHILPGIEMDFWGTVASSLILSVINSLVNLLVPTYNY